MSPDRLILIAAVVGLAAACTPAPEAGLPGQLEWDRIAVPAESSETVVEIAVNEGQPVAAGELLARLDPQRADLAVARAEAGLGQARAYLDQLRVGARGETRDAADAALRRAHEVLAEAERERERREALHRRGLLPEAELDRARSASRRARADLDQAQAQRDELQNGTRAEQLRQAEAALAVAEGALQEAQLTRERLSLRAPRAGRVDALPFKIGDRPPAGAAVVSLLAGEAPYARVFVPAGLRAQLQPGRRFELEIEGVGTPFEGRLRSVASEPAFTPYYALAGDDASRLVYRAEIELLSPSATSLAAGLPLRATVAPP